MAVAPTGNIFKSLEFDGESSKGYGVYITGEAVYNAPERAVEMVTIPGRNGALALDQGRFENIEVTYPAGIYADSELDFAQAISDFRNFLCSKNGYCRLTDDYNPDEYRMAIYKSGLEVTPAQLRAGEFEITFECKPQRFLMSGESAITVADGDAVFNPTLFESSPLLFIRGNGSVSINGQAISIDEVGLGELGRIRVSEGVKAMTNTLDLSLVNTGDAIYQEGGSSVKVNFRLSTSTQQIVSKEITGYSGLSATHIAEGTMSGFDLYLYMPELSFVKGTQSEQRATAAITITSKSRSGPTTYTYNFNINLKFEYTGDTDVNLYSTITGSSGMSYTTETVIGVFFADSTRSITPDPAIIDLETGEAYCLLNGEVIDLNNHVSIPAKLPTLVPGTNTIGRTSDISGVEITPRWWKI